MADFRALDSRIYNNRRFRELDFIHRDLYLYAIFSNESRLSKGVGIFNISTTCFPDYFGLMRVQNMLGRTDWDLKMTQEQLCSSVRSLSDSENELMKIGTFNKFFHDLLEYDPINDMIFIKLMFQFSTLKYLTTSKAIVEGIHKDFTSFFTLTSEKWWAEFVHQHLSCLEKAWREYSEKYITEEKLIKEKKQFPVQKTFFLLFELEKKYYS